MKKAILATKVGMTQIFDEDGSLIPVTVLQAGPCAVTQIKTVENDGYEAVQVGFVDKKEKIVSKDQNGKKEIAHRNGVNKAGQGHFKKAGVSANLRQRNFRSDRNRRIDQPENAVYRQQSHRGFLSAVPSDGAAHAEHAGHPPQSLRAENPAGRPAQLQHLLRRGRHRSGSHRAWRQAL